MNKKIVIGIIIVAVVGGLIVFARVMQSNAPFRTWADTQVRCLEQGHVNLAVHIHPEISIMVDGEEEFIPGNIGVNAGCMAEVHTHEANGVLHVETVLEERLEELSLSDFFAVSGMAYVREGYDVRLSVNGEDVSSPERVAFRDHDVIVIEYTSLEDVSGEEDAKTTPDVGLEE